MHTYLIFNFEEYYTFTVNAHFIINWDLLPSKIYKWITVHFLYHHSARLFFQNTKFLCSKCLRMSSNENKLLLFFAGESWDTQLSRYLNIIQMELLLTVEQGSEKKCPARLIIWQNKYRYLTNSCPPSPPFSHLGEVCECGQHGGGVAVVHHIAPHPLGKAANVPLVLAVPRHIQFIIL